MCSQPQRLHLDFIISESIILFIIIIRVLTIQMGDKQKESDSFG